MPYTQTTAYSSSRLKSTVGKSFDVFGWMIGVVEREAGGFASVRLFFYVLRDVHACILVDLRISEFPKVPQHDWRKSLFGPMSANDVYMVTCH